MASEGQMTPGQQIVNVLEGCGTVKVKWHNAHLLTRYERNAHTTLTTWCMIM